METTIETLAQRKYRLLSSRTATIRDAPSTRGVTQREVAVVVCNGADDVVSSRVIGRGSSDDGSLRQHSRCLE